MGKKKQTNMIFYIIGKISFCIMKSTLLYYYPKYTCSFSTNRKNNKTNRKDGKKGGGEGGREETVNRTGCLCIFSLVRSSSTLNSFTLSVSMHMASRNSRGG